MPVTKQVAVKGWYVTALTKPTERLDGPYPYERCQIECLRRLDPATVRRYVAAGTIPALYLPRLFEVPAQLSAYIKEEVSTAVAGAARLPRGGGVLPSVVYTYTRGNLVLLCEVLGLPTPAASLDRAAILDHINEGLLRLAPVSAWSGGKGGTRRK